MMDAETLLLAMLTIREQAASDEEAEAALRHLIDEADPEPEGPEDGGGEGGGGEG